MKPTLHIDFVSDVSCPWCAIGLSALTQALARLQGELAFTQHCQPFELNPQMGPGGQDITAHLTQKYGSTPAQQAQVRQTIRQRGPDAGFSFNPDGRGCIYNTFKAHRLLLWAAEVDPALQLALKQALLVACHTHSLAMDDDAVREQEAFYTSTGIHAVPAVVVNRQHLISGGQPVDVYVQALPQIAAEAA